jgi:predicted aldo/keto reductase-like oxidoreductase
MRYREINKAGVKVSVLGLGCMRLPQDGKKIDRPHALRMMHTAADRGVNYFDTAYMYHGGESELVVAEALKEIGRDKVFVATKMPCSSVETKGDLDRILDDQLKKLDVNTIDFYLLHAVSANTWKKMEEFEVQTFLDKAVESGKIRFPGFSHHDSLNNFMEVLDAYPGWVISQVILNYMDEKYQAGLRGCQYAAAKNVGTVVMEPLKGGWLADKVPDGALDLFRAENRDVSAVEWALRWLSAIPQVSCILSGASSMRQLEENLDSFDRFGRLEGIELTDAEVELFESARLAFLQHKGVGCTSCGYCMPCPAGVDIPGVFANYNLIKIFDSAGQARMRYPRMIYSGTSGEKCAACGRCGELCPQKLPIPELLKEAHEAMSS